MLISNLTRMVPGELDVAALYGVVPTTGDAGSPALDTALRLARHAQGPHRPVVACPARRPGYDLPGGGLWVPFGNTAALAAALRTGRVGAVLLETVPGGAEVVLPPPGYLRELRQLCDQHEALWIADETRCGLGRTGRLFAFEHDRVVPDLVALGWSSGRGGAAGGGPGVGAVLTRAATCRWADPAAMPTPPQAPGAAEPGGNDEVFARALQALVALWAQDLIGNAERTGRYLLRRLEGLRMGYPDLVLDVRGRGLLVGLTLAETSTGALRALRLEPPLSVQPEQVDEFVDDLDELLNRRPPGLVADCLRLVTRRWPGAGPLGAGIAAGSTTVPVTRPAGRPATRPVTTRW